MCNFTFLSTVFQSFRDDESFHDDGQMIMKGCVKWNPVYS